MGFIVVPILDEATEAAKDGFQTGGMFFSVLGVFVGTIVIIEPSSQLKYVLQVGALGAAIGVIGGALTAVILFLANI
jgi:hypothetical protein